MKKAAVYFLAILIILDAFVSVLLYKPFSPWQKLAPMPITRTEMASALSGGEIYLIGGYLSPNSLSVMQKYSPVLDTWLNLKDLPLALDHTAAVSAGDYIYEIGGLYLAEKGSPSKEVFRYSIKENKWETMADLPKPLGAVSAVLIGKTIHVFGGIGGLGSSVASHYVYDIDSKAWSEEPPMPAPNDHMAVATDGVKVFLAGGREKFPDSVLSRLFIYDSKTKLWQEGPNLPMPRGDMYGAIAGKYFIVAGGENDKGKVFDAVEALNIETMQWTILPSLRSVRHGASAVSLNGYFYLVGGRDANQYWGYIGLNERLEIK